MARLKLLLIFAAALIAGMVLSYWAAFEIHRYRQAKGGRHIAWAVLAIALAICGFCLTLFVTGGFIAFILGIIVGFTPFFHIENKETEDQIKATNRDRAEREKKFAEEKAKRENRK